MRLVESLGENDTEWLEVLVAASADDRPAVAAVADVALRERVDRWAGLPPAKNSIQVGHLAHLLAQQAPRLPSDRRHLAHSLAERLLDWPIDGRLVDAARLIADCELVLLLPRGDGVEIRVAAAAMVSAPQTSMIQPQSTPEPAPTPAPITPPPPRPEARAEPKAFQPSGPMRISDD